MNTAPHFSSATDMWSTPQKVFDELNAEFKFTLDPCATKDNAKCDFFYTKEDDGLAQIWDGERVFMNPPYGNDRPLFPLESLKIAHSLVRLLSKESGHREDSLAFSESRGVTSHVIYGKNGLFSFDDKIGQNLLENDRNVSSVYNPLPSNTFIQLSRLLTDHFTDSEVASKEFNRRFMDHLNLQVEPVIVAALSGLAFSSRFSLMDAYTAFSVNDPSEPGQSSFIHDFIVPLVGGYIKWCRTAIPGIGKWVQKAAQGGAQIVVCLLPARTDTRWWHDYIQDKAEVRFIKGRLKFGDSKNSAPFPSCIVIFNPQP